MFCAYGTRVFFYISPGLQQKLPFFGEMIFSLLFDEVVPGAGLEPA